MFVVAILDSKTQLNTHPDLSQPTIVRSNNPEVSLYGTDLYPAACHQVLLPAAVT